MLQGAVERGTFLSADSRLAEEEGELQKNPTAFFVRQGHAHRGNVPMETEIGKRRPKVLPFLREWVPWDAEQICDIGHLCQVIVILIYVCQRSGGHRRPENHEVVNPFEDWADLICVEDFNTRIRKSPLDPACQREAFDGVVLNIDCVPPGHGQIFIVSRDDR